MSAGMTTLQAAILAVVAERGHDGISVDDLNDALAERLDSYKEWVDCMHPALRSLVDDGSLSTIGDVVYANVSSDDRRYYVTGSCGDRRLSGWAFGPDVARAAMSFVDDQQRLAPIVDKPALSGEVTLHLQEDVDGRFGHAETWHGRA